MLSRFFYGADEFFFSFRDDDVAVGSRGNDVFFTCGGLDLFSGGRGNDVFLISSADTVIIEGGPGKDIAVLDRDLDWTISRSRTHITAQAEGSPYAVEMQHVEKVRFADFDVMF